MRVEIDKFQDTIVILGNNSLVTNEKVWGRYCVNVSLYNMTVEKPVDC